MPMSRLAPPDMLGPEIDERHVLTSLDHMGTSIPADGTRSDDNDFPAHGSPLHFSCDGGRRRVR
jgi:hypothetical protein